MISTLFDGLLWLLIFVVLYLVLRFIWVGLRLRRGLRVLKRQLIWSIRHVPRDKLVLDVGAGPNPHIRADVICDKFIYDDFHRGAEIARHRPLIAADASALPFKTGVFEFVISNQVIEHLEDPAGFFEEAGRVAKQGLFACPSVQFEHLYSYAGHLWTIEHKENTLFFTAKPTQVLNPVVHNFVAKYLMSNVYDLDEFLYKYEDVLNIYYAWTNKPQIVVNGRPFVPPIQASTNREASVTLKPSGKERLRAALKKGVQQSMHRLLSSHQNVNLNDILACPKCHGDVSVHPTKVHCPCCRVDYPVEDGIPMMLLDHAQPV